MNNLFALVISAIKSVPLIIAEAAIKAIPRDIESGIYAGWLKVKLFLEMLVWACQADNATALGLVVGVANQFVSEVEAVMTGVSGSAILKACAESSTLFLKSRQMLETVLPQIEALGFNPASPITKAVIASVKTAAITAKAAADVAAVEAQYAPPVDNTPIDQPVTEPDAPPMVTAEG